jgi:hypothetical protein
MTTPVALPRRHEVVAAALDLRVREPLPADHPLLRAPDRSFAASRLLAARELHRLLQAIDLECAGVSRQPADPSPGGRTLIPPLCPKVLDDGTQEDEQARIEP